MGRTLIVSPLMRVSPGDDVLVPVGNAGPGDECIVVGELVRRTGQTIRLRRFNPAQSITVELADGAAVAKVVGEAY